MTRVKTSRTWLRTRCPAAIQAAALIFLLMPAASTGAQDETPIEDDTTASGRAWSEVRQAYDKAKRKALEMGETVPDKIPDWVKEDLENVGDWEYRVVAAPRDEIEATLNRFGAERWECFSVEIAGKKAQLVFKRRKRSRLRELQDLSPDDLLTVIKLMRERRLDKE